MKLNKFKCYYILSDFVSAAISWTLFYIFRKVFIESHLYSVAVPIHLGVRYWAGIVTIPSIWLLFYFATGYYSDVLRKTRLEDFGYTFFISFLGVLSVFFAFILDDIVGSYQQYYELFMVLWVMHFGLTLIFRLIITSSILKKIQQGKIQFRTIIIGRSEKIQQVCNELDNRFPGHGHNFVGCIPVDRGDLIDIQGGGNIENIHDMVKEKQAEDVIIALNESDADIYRKVICDLNGSNVVLKINTDLYPVVKGKVIISSLFRYPLIQVSRDLMSPWRVSLKQIIDFVGALVGLVLSLPVSAVLVVSIKLTSRGSVFYSHERIGRFGKPFRIYKFRSMYTGAEAKGPQLASENDCRITPLGRVMRRFKLDEIPNLFNVLKGDMSLVGPRPERKFYIDQIVERQPEYRRLLKVKPGVTSWGQVKYGYAKNVDEMVRRMRYDLLYVENMSLYVDFQILVRTVLIIICGNKK